MGAGGEKEEEVEKEEAALRSLFLAGVRGVEEVMAAGWMEDD